MSWISGVARSTPAIACVRSASRSRSDSLSFSHELGTGGKDRPKRFLAHFQQPCLLQRGDRGHPGAPVMSDISPK